jgi:hypothetical protein
MVTSILAITNVAADSLQPNIASRYEVGEGFTREDGGKDEKETDAEGGGRRDPRGHRWGAGWPPAPGRTSAAGRERER